MALSSPCRICGNAKEQFLDLGTQPLSDTLVSHENGEEEYLFELQVGMCTSCRTVQLMREVPREKMFTEHYPFFTSSSQGMVNHFTETAERLLAQNITSTDPFIVEIGANDGTFLSVYAEKGIRHMGVDPAGLPGRLASDRAIHMTQDFFGAHVAREILQSHGQANVIYAANTLCHIPYLEDIFQGIDILLTKGGFFVFEDPYIGDIIDLCSFDQIYDEHYYFFSATTVVSLAARWGLELVDVERLPVHGGEVRYTLARAGVHTRNPRVAQLLSDERGLNLHEMSTMRRFARRVKQKKTEIVDALTDIRHRGLSVAGYAATAKSATILNYCEIDDRLLPVIYDTTEHKQGRRSPGVHIPIEPFPSPEEAPDVYLLFAWNHTEEIIMKEVDFTNNGGKWLRYVPEVTLTK